jgi:hypothetical protein
MSGPFVCGDDGVVGVVAAEQKHAYQRAIIRAVLRQGGDQAERTESQRTNRCRSNANESAASELEFRPKQPPLGAVLRGEIAEHARPVEQVLP